MPPDGLMASTPAAMPSPLLEGGLYTIKEQSVTPIVLPLPPLLPAQASDSARAGLLAYIEAASHKAQSQRAATERDNKGTGMAYAHHVQNYSGGRMATKPVSSRKTPPGARS